MSTPARPVVRLLLRAEPDCEFPTIALRILLKRLLRHLKLRAITVEFVETVTPQPPTRSNTDAES